MLCQIEGGVQNYDWGKLGDTSLVAKFAACVNDIKINESEPYAELWMGSHPKLPSQALGSAAGQNLREIVTTQPHELGRKITTKFGPGELPYLFKVLSIRKALSIQAHPDKALAKVLHARDPKNYPDDNHKPEMAIALTDFEGFCGFRPLTEIHGFLSTVPEFEELVGSEVVQEFNVKHSSDPKGALKVLFSAVMHASQAQIDVLAPKLAARAAKEGGSFAGGSSVGGGQALASLLVRVDKQFPKDVGLFCGGLMLNYVTLDKGEAMFLRAKDPHAYISGDIIECMAASDNVVRAGFTPKFKDVETLVDMLTYDSGSVADQKMRAAPFNLVSGGTSKLFDPPIEEFAVLQQTTTGTASFEEFTGASIFIVTEGSGRIVLAKESLDYEAGFAFFAGAHTAFNIEAKTPTVSYHAIAEV